MVHKWRMVAAKESPIDGRFSAQAILGVWEITGYEQLADALQYGRTYLPPDAKHLTVDLIPEKP